MKVETLTVRIDPKTPTGVLHAFAREAAAKGAVSVLAAYVTRDGKCEAVRMGQLDMLEMAAKGIAAGLASELEEQRTRFEDVTQRVLAPTVTPGVPSGEAP